MRREGERDVLGRVTHVGRRLVGEVRGGADLWAHRVGLRSSSGLRLPDFLGIGAQKAGSTWLHANLIEHPQLYLPGSKELHFFDWYRIPTLRRYAEEFAPAGGRVAGEITPGYSALTDRRVAMVRQVLPDAKILLLLRDPVERAWSQLRMDLARKRDRDVSAITAREVASRLDERGVRRRSDLASVVRRWSTSFGAALWIGSYEDIRRRPEQLLAGILDHLGVDPHVDMSGWPLRQRFNAGADELPPPAVLAVLVDRLGDQREQLRRVAPDTVAGWDGSS